MAKRIYSSRVKKWAIGAGITAVPLAILLIWYLTTLGVIDVTGISGSTTCAGTEEDPCLAFVNFSVKEDIFLYPSDDWSSTPFYTDVQPKSVMMYRSWGKYWRKIDLTKGCTGSWCGCYWCTKSNTAVFSYVFRNNSDYQLKFVALKENPSDTIKWGFGPVDPFWYGINDTANISTTSLNLELGSQVNISTNITGATKVCVDIDHPTYGTNYTCGTPNADFLFNISYFRKTELNDTNITQNLTYTFEDIYFNLTNSTVVNAPNGVTTNGTLFWVTDSSDDEVDIYYANKSIYGSFDTLANGSNNPHGIIQNGTYIWVVDYSDEYVYRFYMNGTPIDYTNLPNDNDYPYGITMDDTYFYILHGDVLIGEKIYRYYLDWTFVDTFNVAQSGTTSWLYGIAKYGNFLYVTGYKDTDDVDYGRVIKYSANDGEEIEYYNIDSVCSSPQGIDYEDGYFWIVCGNTLHQFDTDFNPLYGDTQYFYIASHQYDELVNLSFNVTGYNYSNIDVWFNGSLLESVGEVYEGNINTTVEEELVFARPVPDTEIFNIDVSIDANVTSATWNVTGVYEFNTLDQESTTIDTYGYATDDVLLIQSFTPEYSNFSNVRMALGKENYFASDTIYVRFGTTINGSEMGNTTINPAAVNFRGSDWESATMKNNTVPGTTYYITLESSTANEVYWWRSELGDNPYPDGQASIMLMGVKANFTADMAFKTYVDKFPENITLEVGEVDGTYEWNYTGEYSGKQNTSDFSSEMNDYLVSCTAVAGICSIPTYVTSATPGEILIDAAKINYTTSPNPVSVSVTELQTFLDSSSGATDIPIGIKNTQVGTVGISDIKFDYAGGNDTIEILTYELLQSSGEITNFAGYSSPENLSFAGNENITRNVTINKYFEFTSAYINLSGYSILNGTSIGNDTEHAYAESGFTDGANAVDESWSTTATCASGSTCHLYVNYSGIYYDEAEVTYRGRRLSAGSINGECYDGGSWVSIGGGVSSSWFNYTLTVDDSCFNDPIQIHYTVVASGGSTLFIEDSIEFLAYQSPNNPILYINETNVWNYTGEFNSTFSPNKTSDFYVTLNTALNSGACDCAGCSLNGNNCSINFTFHSDTIGKIEYSNMNLSYNNVSNKENNETLNITVYYSNWNYNFPRYVDYFEFIPNSPTSKNVTPYGQTPSIPIFNFTTYNYGGKNMNLSIYLNGTNNCVNLTLSNTSNKSDGFIINSTWMDIISGVEYLNNTQVWMWADYDCSSSGWSWWFPDIYIRGCCEDCICSEDLT